VPNPLTDELDDETKAVLAAQFAYMKRQFRPMDVEQQRFLNRTWADPMMRFYK
jgi:hypothetical protein